MAGNGEGMATKTRKENQEGSTKRSRIRRAAAKAGIPSMSEAGPNAENGAKKKKIKRAKTETGEAKITADQNPEKPGADLLENAAEAVVSKRCEELAIGLMDAAKSGNASCAKMLVTLTERVRIQKTSKRGNGRSAANLLLSEPDWLKVSQQADGGEKEIKAQ